MMLDSQQRHTLGWATSQSGTIMWLCGQEVGHWVEARLCGWSWPKMKDRGEIMVRGATEDKRSYGERRRKLSADREGRTMKKHRKLPLTDHWSTYLSIVDTDWQQLSMASARNLSLPYLEMPRIEEPGTFCKTGALPLGGGGVDGRWWWRQKPLVLAPLPVLERTQDFCP